MSEEWNEVAHEVELMVAHLDRFHDDLKAARDSGALTGRQMKAVDLMIGQAYGTGILLDAYADTWEEYK